MRITSFIFSLALLFLPLGGIAGDGHDHDHGHSHEPVTQSHAEEIAVGIVNQLLGKGKIDGSWKSTKVNESLKKKFGGKLEWVINFRNEKISDPEKQTLYIFLSLSGEYIAANFSGN